MHRLAVTGWLPVLLVSPLAAQTSPVITEADLLSALDATHPAVAERAYAVAAARAEVTSVTTLPNPVFGVEREAPEGATEQVDWTVSWELPSLSRKLEIRSARRAVEAAEARFSDQRLILRLAVREVYAEWAVAAALQDRLAAQVERIEELAVRERNRAEKGESSGLEAHRLELEAARLRARWSLAEAAAEKARATARAWRPDLPPDAVPVVPPLPPVPILEGIHPQESAAGADLAAAELARKAAGRFLRAPELVAGWQRQETGPAVFEGPVFGVAWPLPLFRRNQAEKARTDARVAALEAGLETVRREIAAERAGALAAYRRLLDAAAEAQKALGGSERMLLGAVTAFHHGEATLTDLLETQRAAAGAETTVLDLQEAALAAHRDLERAAGHALDLLPSTASTSQGDLP